MVKSRHTAGEIIEQAIENIGNDRARLKIAMDALTLLMTGNNTESIHRELGFVMSKYMETAQRSNEQLVKLAALLDKREKVEGVFDLNDNLKDSLYEEIAKDSEE